jgi:hypothetical protein
MARERGQKSPSPIGLRRAERIDLAFGRYVLGPIGEGSPASTHPVCMANSRADLAQSLAPGPPREPSEAERRRRRRARGAGLILSEGQFGNGRNARQVR